MITRLWDLLPALATPCCVRVSCINNQNSHQSTVSLQRFWISWVVCLSFEILRKKWLLDKILAAFLPGYLITTCTFLKALMAEKCLRISAESPFQEDPRHWSCGCCMSANVVHYIRHWSVERQIWGHRYKLLDTLPPLMETQGGLQKLIWSNLTSTWDRH